MSVENKQISLTKLKEGFNIIKNNPQSASIVKWTNHVTVQLREVRQLQQTVDADVHLKRQCETLIGELWRLKVKLENLKKIGRGARWPQQQQLSERAVWKDIQSAFEKRIRTGVIINLRHGDAHTFLPDAEVIFTAKINRTLKRETPVKVNTVLAAEYVAQRNGVEIVETKYFNTENQPIPRTADIKEWFSEHVRAPILNKMEEFEERDSGWKLRSIINLAVNINKYQPMRGSSYIKLPDELKVKKACVNVRNLDNECFKWAVLAALHPTTKNPQRVTKYKEYENELNFDGIEFPMAVVDVPKFEQLNTISINVYVLRKKIVAPVHITKLKKNEHVNLLLVREYNDNRDGKDETEPLNSHYVWIKDLSRLVCVQLSRHDGRKYICDRCLHHCHSVEKLTSHEVYCAEINACRLELPKPPGDRVEFKNFHHKERAPFLIYADFDNLLNTIDAPQQ